MSQFISLNPPPSEFPVAGPCHRGVAPFLHSSCLGHCCSFWASEYLTGTGFFGRGKLPSLLQCGHYSLWLKPLPSAPPAASQLCCVGTVAAFLAEAVEHSPGPSTAADAPVSPPGISVSSLSDNLFVLHVHCEDNKQKVLGAHPSLLQPPLEKG